MFIIQKFGDLESQMNIGVASFYQSIPQVNAISGNGLGL